MRTTGVGFAAAMSRVGAAVGPFLLPMGLAHFGVEFVRVVGAGVLALGGLVSQVLAPNSRTSTWPTPLASPTTEPRVGAAQDPQTRRHSGARAR